MDPKFIRYRKINIFGSESAGKKTLIKLLDLNNQNLEYENDDENYEIIQKIKSSYIKEKMYFNVYIKQLNNNKNLEKYEIENLLYESELVIIIINIKNNILENETNFINNITSFENNKIIILYNNTESQNEDNNSLNEFKKKYSKYQHFDISLKKNDDIEQIKKILYNKLYEDKKINLNNLVLFEEFNPNSMSRSKKKLKSLIKILIMGNSSVGKTSLINRFFTNTFNENLRETIGTDNEESLVKIDKKIFQLSIWDTKGIDKMKSLPMQFYTNTSSYVILYDVNIENSLNEIEYLITQIKENSEKCFIYIIGNKIDLNKRVIQKKDAEMFALRNKAKYGEISCKSGLNVYEIFTNIVFDSSQYSADATQTFLLSIENHKNNYKNKKSCC